MQALTRTRLTVRYDGSGFAGSQVQPARRQGAGLVVPRTVSGTLATGLETLLGQKVKLLWASRTDTGVHAEGNVCAFDVALPVPLDRLADVLNSHLPRDVRICEAVEVAAEWHPRFAARQRVYLYRVWRGRDVPYDRLRYVYAFAGAWNTSAVARARSLLKGQHDFAAFTRRSLQAATGTVCDLKQIEECEVGAEIRWRFTANRFLWRMVCNLAGALLDVAGGKADPGTVAAVLKGERSFKFKQAPARGLVLEEVCY